MKCQLNKNDKVLSNDFENEMLKIQFFKILFQGYPFIKELWNTQNQDESRFCKNY